MKPRRSDLNRELETERFRLIPLNRWQVFRISYPWTKDAELMRNATHSAAPRSPLRWYREMPRPDRRKRFAFAIVPKDQDRPIGIHSLRLGGYRSATFFVVIQDRNWWGKDVVYEVHCKLIDHFIAHGSIERFWAPIAARNFSSAFNYQKLGFQHVGTLHRSKSDPVTGEVFDILMFELMSDDWERRNKEAENG